MPQCCPEFQGPPGTGRISGDPKGSPGTGKKICTDGFQQISWKGSTVISTEGEMLLIIRRSPIKDIPTIRIVFLSISDVGLYFDRKCREASIITTRFAIGKVSKLFCVCFFSSARTGFASPTIPSTFYQRASPNTATALGLYCCIGASVRLCVCANLLCCAWSCRLSLAHNVSRTSSWNVLSRFCLSSLKKKLQKRSPNLVKLRQMLLEVAPELHGKPLVLKMRPGCKIYENLDLIAFPSGTVF